MLCALVAMAPIAFWGCEEPNSTSDSQQFQMGNGRGGGGGSTTTANPELCYREVIPVKRAKDGAVVHHLYVMNADGSNKTSIYSAPNSNFTIGASPTWSPDGSSIVFTVLGNGSNIPDTIKAIDVTVTGGKVVGSNLRTIYGLSTTSMRLNNPFWSASTANEISFSSTNSSSSTLWRISASGGAPASVYTGSKAWLNNDNPMGQSTYSPDDSKLAFVRLSYNGSYQSTIMIFNTATNDYVDSIAVSGIVEGLEWSRSGLNKLAFGLADAGGSTKYIHYLDPATGSVPSTNGVVGLYPAWSPDNSSLMITAGNPYYGPIYELDAFGTSASLISDGSLLAVDWK